jgi:putative photosynthetic complex assembly protein
MQESITTKSNVDTDQLLKPALAGLAVLLCILALVTWHQTSKFAGQALPTNALSSANLNAYNKSQIFLSQRALHFYDTSDGSIDITDEQGSLIKRVSGEAGFVRGVLRTLSHERMRRGLGSQEPFELVVLSDARLRLQDPLTATYIDLDAFGPTNADHFYKLLKPSR